MNDNNINYSDYNYLYVSTTAKHNTPMLRLPDRKIAKKRTINFIVTDETTAIDFFHQVDGKIPVIVVDCESKQNIDLYAIAKKYIQKSEVYTNKPNDLAVESTDVLLQHHFSGDLDGKNILIIGTGNIAFKLALRLAERNIQVFIDGRNEHKVRQIVETINMVIPSYSKYEVRKMDANHFEGNLDAIIPFISAEKAISETYTKWLHEASISIDGGIGNFSEDYIASALAKNTKIIRLDVRIALPFMEASIISLFPTFDFFERVSGEKVIEGLNVVAGGIIGKEGSVIVNQIENPDQIIGIANGYGGVKNESALSTEERRSIELLRKRII
jgi:hypothetical protein